MNKMVFMALPHRERRIGVCMINNLIRCGINDFAVMTSSYGIQTMNLNILYCSALNDPSIDIFCTLHDDIRMPKNWALDMLRIMEENKADILSVVSPIKDERGLTTTAIDELPYDIHAPIVSEHRVRRLPLNEIYDNYPKTFTDPKLLINTGCMMINLRHERAKDLYFRFDDKIVCSDGKYVPSSITEEWLLSRDAQKFGMKVFATRELHLIHEGTKDYDNSKWGTLDTDIL